MDKKRARQGTSSVSWLSYSTWHGIFTDLSAPVFKQFLCVQFQSEAVSICLQFLSIDVALPAFTKHGLDTPHVRIQLSLNLPRPYDWASQRRQITHAAYLRRVAVWILHLKWTNDTTILQAWQNLMPFPLLSPPDVLTSENAWLTCATDYWNFSFIKAPHKKFKVLHFTYMTHQWVYHDMVTSPLYPHPIWSFLVLANPDYHWKTLPRMCSTVCKLKNTFLASPTRKYAQLLKCQSRLFTLNDFKYAMTDRLKTLNWSRMQRAGKTLNFSWRDSMSSFTRCINCVWYSRIAPRMCGRTNRALKREKIRNISLALRAVPSWSLRRAVMRVSTRSIRSSYLSTKKHTFH